MSKLAKRWNSYKIFQQLPLSVSIEILAAAKTNIIFSTKVSSTRILPRLGKILPLCLHHFCIKNRLPLKMSAVNTNTCVSRINSIASRNKCYSEQHSRRVGQGEISHPVMTSPLNPSISSQSCCAFLPLPFIFP